MNLSHLLAGASGHSWGRGLDPLAISKQISHRFLRPQVCELVWARKEQVPPGSPPHPPSMGGRCRAVPDDRLIVHLHKAVGVTAASAARQGRGGQMGVRLWVKPRVGPPGKLPFSGPGVQ